MDARRYYALRRSSHACKFHNKDKRKKKENVDAILAVGLIHPSFDDAEKYPPTAPKILSLISITTAITEKGGLSVSPGLQLGGFHRSRSRTSCPETLFSLQKMDGDVGYLRCFVERERGVWDDRDFIDPAPSLGFLWPTGSAGVLHGGALGFKF